eukprot:COSAG01_NODE_71024_length_257_cov_0.645570_1_plen_31_part_10
MWQVISMLFRPLAHAVHWASVWLLLVPRGEA